MQIYLECLPCNLRQVLEASRMAKCDEQSQKEIMREAIEVLCNYEKYETSPEIARDMHKIVNHKSGICDSYVDVKKKDLETAKRLLPTLKCLVSHKKDKLYWALKAAAVGNVLDSAIIQESGIEENLNSEFEKEFAVSDYELFREKLKDAKKILIICDNCGETVFDTVMMENLPKDAEITYATRNIPIINDATIEDAKASGVEEFATIISSGSNYPGTVLKKCNKEFLDIFNTADVIISKGQGNFETMSECGRGIFFLLKAKCKVVADLLDVPLSSYVFKFI